MNSMKILLVDDSKSARYALRLQLKHHVTEVDMADSAEEALERVKIARPDAVFMDHTMPGMNGLEALEILKADPATAAIPVVMCTSNEEPEYLAQALAKGALDVLAKSDPKGKLPTLFEHLEQVIASAAAPAPAPAPETAAAQAPAIDQEALAALVRAEAAQAVEQALASQPPPAPAMSAEAISDLARREVARGIEDHLEAAMEPMAKSIEERVRAAQDQGLQSALEPLFAAFRERLSSDFQAQILSSLNEQLAAEVERLQTQQLEIQEQQNARLRTQMAEEVVPQVLAKSLAAERTQMAKTAQELIDHSIDRAAQESLLNRVHELEKNATPAAVEEVARRIAKEQIAAAATSAPEAPKGAGPLPMIALVVAVLALLAAAAGFVV